MALNENVVTASMLEAMILRMLSTALAPMLMADGTSSHGVTSQAISAVSTPPSEKSVARYHNDRCSRRHTHWKRPIIV